MRIPGVLCVMFLLLAVGCRQSSQLDKATEDTATGAAESWLQLVDNGQYDQSWDEAAGIFKAAVPKADWNKMLQPIRPPLGKVLSRSAKSKEYTKSLPGVPDGQYLVIQFETSFENKRSAIETVTPALDKDGRWRVSGYFIK